MSQVRRITTLFLVIAVVALAIPQPSYAQETDTTVRLLVELKDKNNELPLTDEEESAVQEEDRLSSLAPRAYSNGNGTVRALSLIHI